MPSADGKVGILGYKYNYYIVGNSDSPSKKLELGIPERAIDFFSACVVWVALILWAERGSRV